MGEPMLVGGFSKRHVNLGCYADTGMYKNTDDFPPHVGRGYTIGASLPANIIETRKLNYSIPTNYTILEQGKSAKSQRKWQEKRVQIISSCRRVAYFNEQLHSISFLTAFDRVKGSKTTNARFQGIHKYCIRAIYFFFI